jgi:hypothetical protein
MGFLEDAEAAANMPIPGPGTPDEARKRFDAMPIDALAGLFCSLQYLTMREQAGENWDAILYFDQLPHDQPERAFALILAVLRSEAHKSVKMELNTRLFGALLHAHGEEMIGVIEAEARDNPQLRWLAGGECNTGGAAVSRRMRALADSEAWWVDYNERQQPKEDIDFRKLSIPELARVWIDQKVKPHKDQDDNWMTLCDYERELHENNPNAVLDLVLEILRIETDPGVLSFVAAGPLEDLVSMQVIDRIEREAAANEKFRELLRGVWYWNESDELKRRLDAITGLKYADA